MYASLAVWSSTLEETQNTVKTSQLINHVNIQQCLATQIQQTDANNLWHNTKVGPN